MKIIRIEDPVITVQQFAETHDLTMEIYTQSVSLDNINRVHVWFRDCVYYHHSGGDIMVHGHGSTEEKAIANCAQRLSNKTVIITSRTDRQVIHVGRLG